MYHKDFHIYNIIAGNVVLHKVYPWTISYICNGYGVWINKTKHSGLDLMLFNRLRESWRTSPESWHLSRIYNTITVYITHNHIWRTSLPLSARDKLTPSPVSPPGPPLVVAGTGNDTWLPRQPESTYRGP